MQAKLRYSDGHYTLTRVDDNREGEDIVSLPSEQVWQDYEATMARYQAWQHMIGLMEVINRPAV